MPKKPKSPKLPEIVPESEIVVIHGAPRDNSVHTLEDALFELQDQLEGEAYLRG